MANPDTTPSTKGHKATYATPSLTIYGSVRDLTGGNSGADADSGTFRKNPQSDARYKEQVVRVGDHPLGFGLYLFDYKPQYRHFGEGRQFGVLAQEVEPIVPTAVSLGEDGYRVVDYGMLGISRH